jgi:hypothetical protein
MHAFASFATANFIAHFCLVMQLLLEEAAEAVKRRPDSSGGAL